MSNAKRSSGDNATAKVAKWEKVWKSKFKEDHVTLPQWLAEQACERKAAHERGKLMPRFWQDEKWGKEFRLQVTFANKLLKEFSQAAVIEAWSGGEGKRCYSLGAAWFKGLVKVKQRSQEILDRLVEDQKPEPQSCFPGLPERAPSFAAGKSLADKLRDSE